MNPLLGRWVSADPLAVHAAGEADLNLYAYVSGQILRAIDPLGLDASEAQRKAEKENGNANYFNDSARQNQKSYNAPGAAGQAPGGGDGDSYNGDKEFNNGIGKDNGIPFAEGDPIDGELRADGSTPEGKGNDPTLNETIADLTGDTNRAAHGSNEKGIGIGECQGDGCLDSELGAKAASLAVLADKIADVISGAKAGAKAAAKWAMKGAKSLTRGAGKWLSKTWKKWFPCGKCLVAGTRVILETSVVPIEDIQLGDRVGEYGEDCASLPTDGWTRVDFELYSGGEFVGTVALLRPDDLVADEGLKVGEWTDFEASEDGVVEQARTLSIQSGQEIEPGRGCPVTALIRRVSHDVVTLTVTLGSESERITATPEHPFFSASRGNWVDAADIQQGEYLEAQGGAVLVEAVEAASGTVQTYNIEVFSVHEYRVGDSAIRTHNGCADVGKKAAKGGDAAAERAKNVAAGIPESRLGPSGKSKIHVREHATRGRAEDAAQARSRRGVAPEEHSNPTTGDPHFHPSGSNGREHHTYPGKGFPPNEEY